MGQGPQAVSVGESFDSSPTGLVFTFITIGIISSFGASVEGVGTAKPVCKRSPKDRMGLQGLSGFRHTRKPQGIESISPDNALFSHADEGQGLECISLPRQDEGAHRKTYSDPD